MPVLCREDMENLLLLCSLARCVIRVTAHVVCLLILANLNSCLLQTLIKLERWLDAVEFCNRALHVDGKCVKALSRRASAFVKLAGECSASVHATTGAATCAATTTASGASTTTTGSPRLAHSVSDEVEVVVKGGSTNDEIEVVRGGTGDSIDISSSTTTENVDETVAGARGGEGEGEEKHAFHKSFVVRKELLAQALLDLNAAVDVDPNGGDIRRQRDDLSQEVEEEKVR